MHTTDGALQVRWEGCPPRVGNRAPSRLGRRGERCGRAKASPHSNADERFRIHPGRGSAARKPAVPDGSGRPAPLPSWNVTGRPARAVLVRQLSGRGSRMRTRQTSRTGKSPCDSSSGSGTPASPVKDSAIETASCGQPINKYAGSTSERMVGFEESSTHARCRAYSSMWGRFKDEHDERSQPRRFGAVDNGAPSGTSDSCRHQGARTPWRKRDACHSSGRAG